jgi:TonB family protein
MHSKKMKKRLCNFFLLIALILVVGAQPASISEASEAGKVPDLLKLMVVNFADERNIEKIAVSRVQPAYPPMAQKYKIEGEVTVQVGVNSDGKVTKAEFVRGHNLFRAVSLDAAKRWEFKLSGENSLEGTIRFSFKLNQ